MTPMEFQVRRISWVRGVKAGSGRWSGLLVNTDFEPATTFLKDVCSQGRLDQAATRIVMPARMTAAQPNLCAIFPSPSSRLPASTVRSTLTSRSGAT